jgi:hypothetical protein
MNELAAGGRGFQDQENWNACSKTYQEASHCARRPQEQKSPKYHWRLDDLANVHADDDPRGWHDITLVSPNLTDHPQRCARSRCFVHDSQVE